MRVKQKQIYIACILLVFSILLLLFINSRFKEGFSDSKIPKIIWTYWNSESLPISVQKCIESWKRHNPDYEIRVLNKENLKDYIDLDVESIKWNDMPQRESDIVRIHILEKYGGVWSDATIYMTKPLSFIGSSDTQIYGFYINKFTTDKRYPVIENWFFAAIPSSPFIKNWKEAFMQRGQFSSVDEYLTYLKDTEKVDFQAIDSPHYLLQHVCAQYVMQKKMTPDEIQRTMILKKAEEGPFTYLEANNWQNVKGIESLCRNENITDIIKFRGSERNIIEERKDLQDCVFKL